MPRMSQAEYQAYQLRSQRVQREFMRSEHSPAEREVGKGGLQEQIQDWCNAQWPKWVCDFPRTDLKSTLPVGRHDATVWGVFPKCILVETKAKGKKRTTAQLAWAMLLEQLGWKVHVVYSMEEFLAIVSTSPPTTPPQ